MVNITNAMYLVGVSDWKFGKKSTSGCFPLFGKKAEKKVIDQDRVSQLLGCGGVFGDSFLRLYAPAVLKTEYMSETGEEKTKDSRLYKEIKESIDKIEDLSKFLRKGLELGMKDASECLHHDAQKDEGPVLTIMSQVDPDGGNEVKEVPQPQPQYSKSTKQYRAPRPPYER